MTASSTADQLARLKELGAATVHEAQGGTGALDSAVKPLHPAMAVAGPALTVDCKPADNLAIQHAVTLARPGDVLVVDAKAFLEAGPWGDILTLYAQQVGITGLVIDGSVRDSQAIVDMGFPVFCRGICIKGTGKNQPGKVNETIICGGVTINPGDVVVGDADGVVVVPAGDVEWVIELSEAREQKEARFRTALRDGQSLVELMSLGPKLTEHGYR
ncbi:4-carboxy-4-hydroxy-2-oxoadipate aldolase/oxaloacetate decarboxylase [Saccharopolyspora spinosa]|uniref:Putative 4-hydroxy-4-methyl-2-oxoglutarate aldolase n=1 Tax=Saccharopolyspora spinosa TaxID=60894 RepID=A0A2N3Y5M2_SACSN|nr:4-carboxy-4-hydroxy-2-oxoadipate aldolase/oxaloacetate decarboxylase [Saccharopolyspora spinosa]PKW18224.1 4-hydroxy-4-methyl-2-oxoglutarate aldolase [Saccharopolyspora spinosa]